MKLWTPCLQKNQIFIRFDEHFVSLLLDVSSTLYTSPIVCDIMYDNIRLSYSLVVKGTVAQM